MPYDFRPAVRANTSVLVGLSGASGSGKTLSALKLATGLARGGKIAFIDTERGRALHYAPAPGQEADPSRNTFAFDHLELDPPFAPDAYLGAIVAAEERGARVIVVDSFSHEWEGEGGVLDMQEAEFARMGAREAVKMTSWIKPKGAHKKMMSRLIQCRAHLVICLRAQEKIKIVKGPNGKQEIVAAEARPENERWEPICEKRFPYELTVSFVLTPTAPGIPVPVKLQSQHAPFFPLDKHLDEAAGAALAAWSTGAAAPTRDAPAPAARPAAAPAPAAPSVPRTEGALTRGEVKQLEQLVGRAIAANLIKPSQAEALEVAVHDKDAAAVRAGIAQLTAALGQPAQAGLGV